MATLSYATTTPLYTYSTLDSTNISTLENRINRLEKNAMELNNILMYLTEDEIKDYCNKVIEREENKYAISNIICSIVEARHFTEEFLKEYYEYLNIPAIYVKHKADIVSGQYAGLKLLFIAKEEEELRKLNEKISDTSYYTVSSGNSDISVSNLTESATSVCSGLSSKSVWIA